MQRRALWWRTPRTGSWFRSRVLALSAAALALLAAPAPAQVIVLKIAPVADGDQFAFFPSANLGMGGVSIALADSMLDPFTNPAKGARLRHGYAMGAPSVFSVSGKSGGGQTLPVGALVRSGASFAGLVLVAQRIPPTDPATTLVPPGILESRTASAVPIAQFTPQSNTAHTNRYAFAMLGHRFAAAGVSIGASALVSGLSAIDGAERLYPQSQRVDQDGHASDIRLGALKEWSGNRSLELVLVRSERDMRHDVTYMDQFWDPSLRQFGQQPREVRDADRTRVWGAQLRYERPLADSGWRIGALLTANRQTRPSAVDDAIMGVAQDDGRATAFDIGVGVSKSLRGATFGLDAIYEPATMRTRALVDSTSADALAIGTPVLDNRFRFSNGIVRAGASQEFGAGSETKVRLSLGVELHANDYRLTQRDLADDVTRRHDEQWLEWARTWGVGFRFASLDVQYRGRLMTGAGRPGVSNGDVFLPPPIALDAVRTFAPVPVALGDVHVVTHQVSVSVPVR